ncbi:uncharacterized protein LOC122948563 [Acropora millepora]|uniref:uncharacterized protein LOC122948563 n=1 Tax=Acropora millepora TaxID=45264 RepID=UPI001CF3E5B6|nr:uncharacterized protein LOC122948563 [Acropora millepora]
MSEEFEVKFGVHQGSTLSLLLFAIVVDVIMGSVRNGLKNEMLYGLVLTSKTIEGLREKFWKWKVAYERKGLKVNLGKTKVAVSGAEGEVTVRKGDPRGICGRECGELLKSKRFSLKLKGIVYVSSVRLTMLYVSETSCLRENETATFKRTDRAIVRAMCGAIVMEKKRKEELIEMLGLKERPVAKANRVRWYGYVLRRDDSHVLRKALEFEVRGKRRPGRPKETWKMQAENESKSIGLEKKDAMNQARWRLGVREVAAGI